MEPTIARFYPYVEPHVDKIITPAVVEAVQPVLDAVQSIPYFDTVRNIVWPNYWDIREFKYSNPEWSRNLFLGFGGRPQDHLVPFAIVIAYVVGIYSLKLFWEKFKLPKLNLKYYNLLHNLSLSVFSLFITLAIMWDMLNLYNEYSLHALMCDTTNVSPRGRLMWWYYIFYVSKFFELVETFMLVVTKRPIIFLHVYHHFITLLLSYVNIVNDLGVQWCVIIANSTVHVIMYFYYFLKTLGYNPWWKKYVTRIQILQFCFDLFMACIGFCYMYYFDWGCTGGVFMWLTDLSIIASFLFLFISFYKQTYTSSRSQRGKSAAATGDAGSKKKRQ